MIKYSIVGNDPFLKAKAETAINNVAKLCKIGCQSQKPSWSEIANHRDKKALILIDENNEIPIIFWNLLSQLIEKTPIWYSEVPRLSSTV